MENTKNKLLTSRQLHNWQNLSIFASTIIKKDFEISPVCDKWGKSFFVMVDHILLLSILTPAQVFVLETAREIRDRVRNGTDKEPPFALPQNYLVSLLRMSPVTVVGAIDRLCELKVIAAVSNKFGECIMYRFNPGIYRNLLKAAKRYECVLRTGRKKTPQKVSPADIVSYMIGKSIRKNMRPQSRAGRQK